jgi:DNA-binding MarR family transcriptional regulator
VQPSQSLRAIFQEPSCEIVRRLLFLRVGTSLASSAKAAAKKSIDAICEIHIMIYIQGKNMIEDVVKELGFLTRFKRIGEALQAQTQALLTQHGIDMPAAHFPLLAALDWHGALGVGELSQAVGVSQPVVTRSLKGLEDSGLVQSEAVEGDRRVRRVALSSQGQALVQRAQRDVWPVLEASVAQVCASLEGPLLDQLEALEAGLARTSLLQRSAVTIAVEHATGRRKKTPRAPGKETAR